MPATTASLGRRLSWLLNSQPERPVPIEDAASRIAAFVYGNILVLAALIALHPEDLAGPKAAAYVVGTGVSTFVAHLLAESVGTRVRTGRRLTAAQLRHELRDCLPIVSATTLPALLMGAALLGWLAQPVALAAAIGVTVLRLAALGRIVGRLRGQRASARTFLSGVLLALAGIGAAALKWWLTH
jgi:putative Mn2+ efflux pump MntP